MFFCCCCCCCAALLSVSSLGLGFIGFFFYPAISVWISKLMCLSGSVFTFTLFFLLSFFFLTSIKYSCCRFVGFILRVIWLWQGNTEHSVCVREGASDGVLYTCIFVWITEPKERQNIWAKKNNKKNQQTTSICARVCVCIMYLFFAHHSPALVYL